MVMQVEKKLCAAIGERLTVMHVKKKLDNWDAPQIDPRSYLHCR